MCHNTYFRFDDMKKRLSRKYGILNFQFKIRKYSKTKCKNVMRVEKKKNVVVLKMAQQLRNTLYMKKSYNFNTIR